MHSIFGAFLFGLIVPRDSRLFEQCENKIGDFVMTILLPLYFALSGLKTDVTQIQSGTDGAMVVLVCVVATVGKLIGAGVPSLVAGLPFREASVVAVLMNTRGLVELIVLNLGLSSGVLNTRTFSVMVLMALFTTFLTCPVVNYIFPPHLRVLEEPKHEPAPDAGDEVLAPDAPLDTEAPHMVRTMSLQRLDSVRLAVVVDKFDQLPLLMSLLFLFAPASETSRLRTQVIRLVEPTNSERDKFLFATEHGHVISVEPESTTLTSDAAAKPELISLSLFCRAIGSEVAVSRVVGDPNQFAKEIKRLTDAHAADLTLMPWRDSKYNEKVVWSTILRATAPVALLIDLSEAPAQPSALPARCLRDVIVLVTLSATDAALLQIAKKLLESRGVNVTVIVPGDYEDCCPPLVRGILEDLEALLPSHANLAINFLGFDHTSLEGFYRECSSNVYDLILVSYIEPAEERLERLSSSPTATIDAPRQNSVIRGRARTGTLSMVVDVLAPSGPDDVTFRRSLGVPENIVNSGLQHPEFGLLVDKLFSARLANCILVLHPPRDPSSWNPKRKMSIVSDTEGPSTPKGRHMTIDNTVTSNTGPASLATIQELQDSQEFQVPEVDETLIDSEHAFAPV